jgi:hypothetical protein
MVVVLGVMGLWSNLRAEEDVFGQEGAYVQCHPLVGTFSTIHSHHTNIPE